MKKEIRNHFKSLRDKTEINTLTKLSQQAQELLLSCNEYKSAENIMIYLPLGNETDTSEIISRCFEENKTVLLPVTNRETCHMDAVVYTPSTTLEPGAFSVSEPQNSTVFDKNKIDLVIVPGIAFSQRGGRIGFGKGCYDRFLKGIPATKIGFCYDFQLSNLIRCDNDDVEMDFIITDRKIYNCSQCKTHMHANYHTHTYLCHHANGTPREYVETAIDNGLEILGFSDHNPCPFTNGFVTDYRIDLEDTEKYLRTIRQLKEEYKYKIKILVGYEAEYYPSEHENTMNYLNSYGFDYLILGQHFTRNGYDGAYSGGNFCDEAFLKEYVDQVIEGINTGVFSYIAHPDIINYRRDPEIFEREITRLLCEANRLSIPVEFNLLGLTTHRHYPYDKFWEIVKSNGNDVIIGCDAHESDACANPEVYRKALDILKGFGITPIDYLTLKEV